MDNKVRLIDANTLMPLFIKKAYTMKDRHGVRLGEEWLLSYNDIKEVVDNAPTVEYPEQITIKCDMEEEKQKLLSALRNAKLKVLVEEERPIGKWVYKKPKDYICSCCGYSDDNDVAPYCWYCGADMRGGRE